MIKHSQGENPLIFYSNIGTGYTYIKRYVVNKILSEVSNKYKKYRYSCKSYSGNYIALAFSQNPISCDIAKIDYSGDIGRLEKKMKFFLKEDEIKDVIKSEDPYKYAIWGFTRKECIYKMYNVRNLKNFDNIVSKHKTIYFNNLIMETQHIYKDVVLSYISESKNRGILQKYEYSI